MREWREDGKVVLDLDEVELDDGPELARFVTALRARLAAGDCLVLRQCPQMLAHTLYKAALLREGVLELASVREEEPYG